MGVSHVEGGSVPGNLTPTQLRLGRFAPKPSHPSPIKGEEA